MNKKTLQYGVLGLLLAIGIGLVIEVVVTERLEDVTAVVALQQEKQRGLLQVLAETTGRNSADATTEAIVQDCPADERIRFDELLGRLNQGLPRAELLELDRLFVACGPFFADRKTAMVARLQRELEVYENYTAQLEAVTGSDLASEAQLEAWRSLVAFEETQSQYFSELVQLQKDIITALLDGKATDSPEITTILTAVREARQNLDLASTQAATVRTELLAL